MFILKDSVLQSHGLRSRVIYKFTCHLTCTCPRAILCRTRLYMFTSTCSHHFSLNFRYSCSAESFTILDSAASSFRLKIEEAPYIKWEIALRLIPLSFSLSCLTRKKIAKKWPRSWRGCHFLLAVFLCVTHNGLSERLRYFSRLLLTASLNPKLSQAIEFTIRLFVLTKSNKTHFHLRKLLFYLRNLKDNPITGGFYLPQSVQQM